MFLQKTRSALIALAVVLFAHVATAQTHYCDTTPPTSGASTTLANPFSVCAPATDTVTAWKIYIDGAGGASITAITDNTVSQSGLKAYSGTLQALAGTHTYQVSTVNAAGESAKSNPFSLTVSPPLTVPSSPVKLKVG